VDFDVILVLPSTFSEKGLTADDVRFFANICDGDCGTPVVKMGLNGLPSLDGIGRIRPPNEGILWDSIGVLVDDPFLFLIARSRADVSGGC
jgi:hypothetical protein